MDEIIVEKIMMICVMLAVTFGLIGGSVGNMVGLEGKKYKIQQTVAWSCLSVCGIFTFIMITMICIGTATS